MKITKIFKHPAKKLKYIIELDDGASLELTNEAILKFGLRTGDIVDDKDLDKIKKEQDFLSAKDAALRLISRRMRSAKEITDRLKTRGFTEDSIDRVFENLLQMNLINDEEFTRKYISDSLSLKRPIGKFVLKQKLQRFGIHKETVSRRIEELFNHETEIKLAQEAAEKKLKLLKKYPKEKQKQKIYTFLAQRGFNYDIIKKVMGNLNFEIEEE